MASEPGQQHGQQVAGTGSPMSDTSSASHVGQGGTSTTSEDTTATAYAAHATASATKRGVDYDGGAVLAVADLPLTSSTYPHHTDTSQVPMETNHAVLDSSRNSRGISRDRSGTLDSIYSGASSVSPQPVDIGIASASASASAFSYHRQQLSHQIRRKPLSPTSSVSSLAAARASSISITLPPYALDLPKPDRRFDRSQSIDSPTLYEYPSPSPASPPTPK